MSYSSSLFENAVKAMASLPGIGKRSATRLVLHLLARPQDEVNEFLSTLQKLVSEIKYCRRCHNIADEEICSICASKSRDGSLVCIVATVRDVMAIEATGQYHGKYHVLGGVLSPIEGVGPGELNVDSLINRLDSGEVQEVVMALSPTVEGETTIYYLSKLIEPKGIKISTISRGVAFGGELEYADEITLGRSILARLPYEMKKD